ESPEVERWFADRRLPAEETLRHVRTVILRADPRITEYVKYGTVQFAYEGDLANFVQVKDRRVNLMFNRGARIARSFPHLEGDGTSARFMRFADPAEVDARADELSAIVRA